MTQEEKDLLLRDLCARLPYGVKVKHELQDWSSDISSIDINHNVIWLLPNKQGLLSRESAYNVEFVKPYLRPMSSMTEEEMEEMHNQLSPIGAAKYEYNGISTPVTHIGDFIPYEYMSRVIDWLNKKRFDFRGLIPKGLAISTEMFNPYKDKS